MIRDPRNPDPKYMVAIGSSHPAHAGMRKTLVLLRLGTPGGPIHFVVEGVKQWPEPFAEMQDGDRYFYEEHTCPTNFIRVPLIAFEGDLDPHGLFEHVETVWMMDEYESESEAGRGDDYLVEVFPVLLEAK
jgi:hypothetical protein